MLQKIKSWLYKDRLDGHQPETDPEGPPPKSRGLDTTRAPESIEPPKNKDNPRKPLIEFEVNNSYDVKKLRRTAEKMEDEAKTLRKIADRMEKGYNIQVGDVKDE